MFQWKSFANYLAFGDIMKYKLASILIFDSLFVV